MNISKELAKILDSNENKGTKPYDTKATVKRVENGIAWVHIPGGVDETPAQLTINAKPGDSVQVRVADGKAFLVGNGSAPPTDDTTARQAIDFSKIASDAANAAVRDASTARTAADSAQAAANHAEEVAEGVEAIAESAKTAADTAFTNLSQVQSVLEVAQWIATHGTYVKATVFNPNATYYTITATQVAEPSDDDKDSQGILIYYELDNGIYVRTTDTSVDEQKTYYRVTGTPVAQPNAEHIADYYTLAVSEAMADYVQSHLALTDEGLYVMKDDSKWKVRIKDNGVDIIDGTGTTDVVVASYSTDVLLGLLTGNNVLISSEGMSIRNGTTPVAFFGNNEVRIGDNSTNAGVYLCNKSGKIEASVSGGIKLSRYSEVAAETYSNIFLGNEGISIYNGYDGDGEFYVSAGMIRFYMPTSGNDKNLLTIDDESQLITTDENIQINSKTTDRTGGFTIRPRVVLRKVWTNGGEEWVSLSIGTGGETHGVYSDVNGKWLVYSDTTGNAYISKSSGGYIDMDKAYSVISNIDAGYASVGSVSANSYKNVSVNFARTFSDTPYVTATLYTTSTSQIYSNIQVVVSSVSKTGATLRVINGSGSAVSPGLYWQAIGESY